MSCSRRTAWVGALVVVFSVHLGAPCGPPPPPPPTPCMIRIDNAEIVPVTESYYVVFADVLVATGQEFQAYDFTLTWDNTALILTDLTPHADFDDDGKFSMPVSYVQGSGTTTPVVDVRHGASATGPTKVASLVLTAPMGLQGSFSVSGTVAAPDGTLLPMSTSPTVTTP